MIKALFSSSRFVVGFAVIATFVGSVLLLVWAALAVLRIVVDEITRFDFRRLPAEEWVRSVDRLGVKFIQLTDIILLGTVMYIVSIGLYQLFIDQNLPVPKWLRVSDLVELKRDLIGVTVVLLGVTFLGDVVDWDGNSNIIFLGAAIALVVSALGLILWITPAGDEEEHAQSETGGTGS
jgi:uncharacterized membrane protein YqhA